MSAALAFDRATGQLEGASLVESSMVAALRASAKASAPMGYHGFLRGCRILGTIPGTREIAVRLNSDAVFAFPLGDYHWSGLLDRDYESELARFSEANTDLACTFIDVGTNFGFWSVLVITPPFGAQRAIAIKASSTSAAKVSRNAALNGDRFTVLHRAISSTAGEAMRGGVRHEAEARSIASPADANGERLPLGHARLSDRREAHAVAGAICHQAQCRTDRDRGHQEGDEVASR